MTTKEFSDAFDTLLNSYNNQAIFGEASSRADITLDEYEKSIFLTQALDLIIKQYFERTSSNLGFDDNERRQIDFSSLIRVATPDRYTDGTSEWTIDTGYAANMPMSIQGKGKAYQYLQFNVNFLPKGATVTEGNQVEVIKHLGGVIINLNIPFGVAPATFYTTNKSKLTINMAASGTGDSITISDKYTEGATNYASILSVTEAIGVDDLRSETITYSLTSNRGAGSSYDERGILYKLPTTHGGNPSILFVLNEKLLVTKRDNTLSPTGNVNVTKTYVVKPISYREYDREMSKAYSQPLKKQCWRLFQNSTGIDIVSEIIPIVGSTINTTFEYRIRYVERPTPIVLTTLPEDLEIDGYRDITECSLNPILHMDILNKAVELVLSTRAGRSQLAQHNTATKQ